MENSPLISVIVPVYNVAEYLPECLDSIINQTYTNLEIILVDDGSTDECPKICDEYAEKDGRIRVIHKKNGGLSDARNAGLDICTGEWVGFVDSDDTIHKDMYKILYDRAVEHKADISMCKSNLIISGNVYLKKYDGSITVVNGKENIINEVFCMRGISISVCCKLYKNDGRKICFPIGKTTEDAYAFLDIIKEDDILVIDNIGLYNYRQRLMSITREQMYKRSILDCVDAYEYNFKQINMYHNVCIKAAERRLNWAYCQAMYLILKTKNYKQHFNKIKYLRKKLCKNFITSLRNEKMDFIDKASILLAIMSPIFYKELRLLSERIRLSRYRR